MWFKRRRKTEQDHALSESLKSLQSLLSESGRSEPNLGDRQTRVRPEDEAEDAPAANRRRPVLSSREDQAPGDAGEEPGRTASESGNRWQDLNLSFDAEPVVPKAKRPTETQPEEEDENEEPPASEAAQSEGPGLEPPPDDSDAEPIPGQAAPPPVEDAAETRAEPGDEEPTPDAPRLDEPVSDPTIVHYDEHPLPALDSVQEDTAKDDTGLSPRSQEPILELDLGESEPAEPEDSGALTAGAGDAESLEADDPPPLEEPVVGDGAVVEESEAEIEVVEEIAAPGDEAEPVEARDVEPPAEPETGGIDAAEAPAEPETGGFEVTETQAEPETDKIEMTEAPAEPESGDTEFVEPWLPDTDGIEVVEETPAGEAGDQPAEAGEPEAAEPEPGPDKAPEAPRADPVRPAETGSPDDAGNGDAVDEPEKDQLHLELDIDEADIPTLTEVVYIPGDAKPAPSAPTVALDATPAPAEPAPEPAAPEIAGNGTEAPPAGTQTPSEQLAPPGRSESPHDERVEQCLGNLRVRLQLMGLDALSPGQENELRDALVELLDDLDLD